MSKRSKITAVVIIYFALGFIIYSNVISGQFFYDDGQILLDNYIKDFHHVKEIFSQNTVAGAGFLGEFYRPILISSYAINYYFGGNDPIGYHLVNILLHVFSAILLFFIVLQLFKKLMIAFIAGLIFLIHPAQTEAVSYISGRTDLLLLFFLLVSFLSFLYLIDASGKKDRAKLLFISIISFILALLSKETAVIFPALLVLYCLTLRRKEYKLSRSELFLLMPYAILAVIYQALRMTVFNFVNSFSSFGRNFISRILMFIKTLPTYWQMLIWPTNLYYHLETKLPVKHFDLQVLISILIIIVMILLVWILKSYRKLLLFGFGWFFISMAPVSGILVPINFLIGERWLYLSAIGIFIMVAVFIDKFLEHLSKYKKWKAIIITSLIFYASFFVILGVKRNFVWRDGIAFAKDTLVHAPREQSSKMLSLLGSEYAKRGQIKEALKEYHAAISLDPNNLEFIYNLAAVYAAKNFNPETTNEFDKTVVLSPVATTAFDFLANKYVESRNCAPAIKLLEKATELYPGFWQAYNTLGVCYFWNNQKERAIVSFEKALKLHPGLGSEQIKANLNKVMQSQNLINQPYEKN